jgi:hypothetical protein
MALWRQIRSTAVKTLLCAVIFLTAAWFAANHYRANRSERLAERHSSQSIIREQAAAVELGRATILRAFWYSGKTLYEPKPGRKTLAIDVVIEDTEPGFDLDDIEVVDGRSNESYGSFPDIQYLDDQGNITAELVTSADGRRASFRLIYLVPESPRSIKLRYWGKDLCGPVPISDAAS